MTNTHMLARRFDRSWRELGAQTESAPVFAQLLEAYRQPHRHYHTLEHVEHALSWLDWSYSYAQEPHELSLALWFHDYVYDPRRSDNEQESAARAQRLLLAAGMAEQCVARIVAMILSTRDHAAQRGDGALLNDIDLAILGESAERFQRFEQQVREEYAMFDDLSYARGRVHALGQLATRDPLYTTPLLAGELHDKARQNLAHALAFWDRRAGELAQRARSA